MDLRARFAARFGAGLAASVEDAVERHILALPAPVTRGSDPFRFILVWAVGFECLSRPEFRIEHRISTPWSVLETWIRDEADLGSFDGTMDLAGRGRGLFDGILGPHSPEDVEAGLAAAYAWALAALPGAGVSVAVAQRTN